MDQDINKRNDEKTSSLTLQSQQGPSKPIITNCELVKGVIKFSWKPVIGAKTYRLVIKDEFLQENMVKDEVISGSENTVKIQTTEKLCIGRTCMIKIITFVNNLNAESEWRAYLIGGKLVPRNVQAIQNPDNPKRSILVTFDAPKQGPAKEYKIVIVPEFGKRKTFYCSSNTIVVEYLRKGIKYKFHVFAKHGEEWSDGSISNPQETDQDYNYNPPVSFYGNTESQFDLVGAHFTGNATTVNINKAESFGKVRDLTLVSVREKQPNKNEILKLSWQVPSFDNNAFDYKVEKYKVKIWNINSPDSHAFYLEFVKDSNEYYTDNQELDLGETYNISVSTIYIDIDQDIEYISNAAEEKVQTRPCQPTGVKYNIKTNDSGKVYLKIEWNSAKGATYYTVEIHTDESEQLEPLFMHKVEKGTEWERIFDDRFGYGTSYHAVITAIGNENKSNSKRTDQQTIGGDFAPNKVIATIDHDKVVDPNTEVYLSWEPPTKQPESYEVTFENEGKHIIPCTESELLIKYLKAGAYYTFKVFAIDKQHKKKSGGCVSNRVQTNPTPTLVKNVQTFPGDDCTSINISWDNEEESTKYRVNVISFDEKMSKDMNTTDNWIAVDGLLPDTNYFIRVAGGNSNGFGKDSIVTNFETELGIPKNIYLLNNMTSPDTSLILQFSEAKGKPVNYLGALNKCENQGQHESLVFIDVQPGYTFNELQPNTKYYVMVLCVFENGKKGKAVKSEALMTAPSKPVIDKSGCCTDNKFNSSKVFFLKWKSDRGCREHEIKIKNGDKLENQLIIQNKTELRYSCMHEASQYTAQIRTKNITFGQWSDEAVIDLAPVKLKNIRAELDQESNNILIQCKKEAKDSLSYFCQALCSDKSSGESVLVLTHDDDDKNIVKFMFIPTLYAEKYSFKMWAVDSKGVMGESSLSPYVISRPAKGQITKVERNVKNPSTDIDIIWEALERCDEYEIQIKTRGDQKFETCARSTDTSFNYRCKIPGRTYVVSIRGIRESVRGNLSDKVTIGLVPGQVELIEDRDAQEPVETVQVKWKELETKPEGYRVILYNKRKEEIATETESEFTHHVFEKLAKPGSLCYCTVAAYNTTGEGKPAKSQNYRIKWNTPKLVVITPDENNPSRRAKISWERPHGVTCFRLELENNQSSTVITLHLDATNYIFESGIPGNSYTIRLYSGCDGRYDVRPVRTAMVMIPEPPTSIICEANSHVKGIVVTFKDISNMKNSYEVCAESLTDPMSRIVFPTDHVRAELPNLIPGESYKVSLVMVCKTVRSKKVFYSGYIQTYPDNIKNLRHEFQDGCIIYKWGPPEIAPDEYIVQWRVNNEPMNEDTTTETKFKIDSIKRNQKYKVRIAASNTAGKSKMEILETTIPADETTVALSECKQIEPNKKVHDCVEEILSNKDNPVREDEICTILRDSVSATKPRNAPQGDQDWTSIEEWTSFSIKYKRKSCYRKGSKVFNAIRESGGSKEEIIVKFVPDFNTVNIREIDSLWATIGHENVVRYLQSGYCKFKKEKSIFIAMEKCEKDTLHEKIKAGNLSYAERKSTVYCLAKGLQHLKEKGILHQDLKPQSILYRGDVSVISGFGVSERILPNKSNTYQSEPNLGTNGWRAPETSKENGAYTFAGDIYSAGLVNFYVLTNGKHPFGEHPNAWQYLINNYPDNRFKLIGMERNLEDLKEIGVLDGTIAIDMIDIMLNTNPKHRPTVEAVLENPFFWTVKKRLNFFTDTHMCINDVNPSQSEIRIISELNKREGKYGNQIKDEMENWEDQSVEKREKNLKDQSGEKGKKFWKEKLSFTVDEMHMIQDNFDQQNVPDVRIDKDAMMHKAKKYKNSVTELLRFIRNRHTHMKVDINQCINNQSEEQFLTYFFDRFPHLFVYVYCKIKDNYYGKSKRENCCTDILAEYFPLLQPNIIRNEVNNDSLEIEWEPVICANHYKLEIYTNNSDQKQPVFKNIVGKKAEWTKAFDDKFGYGTSYYAVVTAIGEGNKRSSTCTDIKQTGIRKSIYGKWFEKVPIIHAPGQVELIEDGDAQEFVESVQVKWKELETKPEGYRLILYNGRNEQIATETVTEFTHHLFEKLAKPGSLCYCTVAAYNTTGEGKPAKSQNYRIKWNTPQSVVITPDENNPFRRAKVSWKRPHGVTCFRLDILDSQSGAPITLHLEDTSYIFESGIPGNSYTIRLYSGCDGRYDVRSMKTVMEMRPEPPTSIICKANSNVNGIVVTFRDNSNMKNSYEVCAENLTVPMSRIVLLTDHVEAEMPNLIPGESYKVSLVTICKTVRSKEVFYSDYIQTYPDKIKNLHFEFQDGCLIYKWGPPEIAPDEYIVEWRVNNELMMENTTMQTKFKIDSIKKGQKYEVRIAASNTAGKGKMEILETTIPANEATDDLNECIQTKLNRRVYDFLQDLLTNTNNPVREKEIYSILRDINSTTKPLDTPQDQLLTMEQVFRDAGKSDEYTAGGTPSCQSKYANIPVKEEHVYSDCTLSNVELIEIENIIKLKSEVDMIEFCDCKIGNDYCTPCESQKNTAKCKISKLIISFTDNFEKFFRFFYSTFSGCEIKSLCLLYDNLDDQDVENLQTFMIKGIESLDISYNKKIGPNGFEQIGNITAEQGIKTLKAMNCDLEKTKLEKLFKGLKNVNLRELDIGYNDKLTENGFEMLAKLVASRGIETLKLRGCQLTEKTIQVFYNTLEKTDKKRLLNELDVSYNPKMNPEGCKILGLIIKKFGTTILNLAGCGISEEHLKSLMSMKDIELHAINLRDNSYPGNNMVEIANIVREFKIQELDISDCMFSARKLKNFRTDLNGTKLQKLHLGDKNCELGMEYIQEVCQLLPTVEETLYLRFHRLDNSCRRLLKEQSEKLSVSIQLCDEPQVTLDK